jgi:hypothetical protein
MPSRNYTLTLFPGEGDPLQGSFEYQTLLEAFARQLGQSGIQVQGNRVKTSVIKLDAKISEVACGKPITGHENTHKRRINCGCFRSPDCPAVAGRPD